LVPENLSHITLELAALGHDVTISVDKHDPAMPVHLLPNTPSQIMLIELLSNVNRTRTSYTVEVLQVAADDWEGWDYGTTYPIASQTAPTARYVPVGDAGFAPGDIDPSDVHVVNTKFTASGATEQSLLIGQKVLVVAKADTGWWAGFVWTEAGAAAAGWFPEGCVAFI
jgi:hypothetical protein